MGAQQLFSTALRPQANGIIERSHRAIRATIAKLVDSLARASPKRWPRFIRWAEYKMRNKSLFLNKETNEHVTPYMCVKGYSGSSALRSALDAINEIPEHVVHSTWLAGVVGESKRVTASLAEHLQEQADAVVRQQGEHERVVRFHIGDMVIKYYPIIII